MSKWNIKSSVKSFKSSIILITITVFDIDVITILLQYLFSQKTHNNNTAQSAHPACVPRLRVWVWRHTAHTVTWLGRHTKYPLHILKFPLVWWWVKLAPCWYSRIGAWSKKSQCSWKVVFPYNSLTIKELILFPLFQSRVYGHLKGEFQFLHQITYRRQIDLNHTCVCTFWILCSLKLTRVLVK